MSPADYLEEALQIIEREALFSDRVDWPKVRERAHGMIRTAQTYGDTYEAIEFALRALDDHHSFLMRADEQAGVAKGGIGLYYVDGVIVCVFEGSPADRAGLRVGERILAVNGALPRAGLNEGMPRAGSVTFEVQAVQGNVRTMTLERAEFALDMAPRATSLKNGVALLQVPGHGGDGALPDGRLYQDVLQTLIAEQEHAGARAWIVDLRQNWGGNMWPMLAGLGPLLGEGTLGAFVRAGQSWPWSYRDGASRGEGEDGKEAVVAQVSGAAYTLARPRAPVAVLVGFLTASSGEMTAISFRGGARLFGEPTRGLTTANGGFPLPDGAALWLTTTFTADRAGCVYERGLTPDESVQTDWSAFQTERDPVVQAALAWLTQ